MDTNVPWRRRSEYVSLNADTVIQKHGLFERLFSTTSHHDPWRLVGSRLCERMTQACDATEFFFSFCHRLCLIASCKNWRKFMRKFLNNRCTKSLLHLFVCPCVFLACSSPCLYSSLYLLLLYFFFPFVLYFLFALLFLSIACFPFVILRVLLFCFLFNMQEKVFGCWEKTKRRTRERHR